MPEPWDTQLKALGAFIRTQRKMANLSLRQLADMTSLSNPYLSQIERGLHQPSVRVLKLISDALDVSARNPARPGWPAGPRPRHGARRRGRLRRRTGPRRRERYPC